MVVQESLQQSRSVISRIIDTSRDGQCFGTDSTKVTRLPCLDVFVSTDSWRSWDGCSNSTVLVLSDWLRLASHRRLRCQAPRLIRALKSAPCYEAIISSMTEHLKRDNKRINAFWIASGLLHGNWKLRILRGTAIGTWGVRSRTEWLHCVSSAWNELVKHISQNWLSDCMGLTEGLET